MFVLRKNKEQYFNFQGKTHRIVRGNSHWCDNQSHFQICMVALHYTCKWKLTLKTKLTIAYTMSVTKSNSHDGKRSIQSINCHITVTTGQIYSGSTFHVVLEAAWQYPLHFLEASHSWAEGVADDLWQQS